MTSSFFLPFVESLQVFIFWRIQSLLPPSLGILGESNLELEVLLEHMVVLHLIA